VESCCMMLSRRASVLVSGDDGFGDSSHPTLADGPTSRTRSWTRVS
jgi:hypothetical protein